jgi:hypothetical protein
MGRVQKLRDKVGLTDTKLIARGIPARGRVVEVRRNIALDFAADAPPKPKKGLLG